jgi:NADH-ubiquinone oxidoreductase chain 2
VYSISSGKQMVLSAALDKGYIFLSLIAIITSVIGAVYYLNIIKEMFFYSLEYTKYNLYNVKAGIMMAFNNILIIKDNPILFYNCTNITISSFISITISTITLIILLFIVENKQCLSMATMLVGNLFST